MATADTTPPAGLAALSTSAASNGAASTLQANLHKLAARRNAVRMWQAVAVALSWGSGAAVLMILAYRFYLVDGAAWMPFIPIVFSLLVGWRNGVLARGSTFVAALEADESLDLKERLSSALAFVQPDIVTRARRAPIEGGVLPRLRAFIAPRLVTEPAFPVAPTTLVPSLVQDAAIHVSTLNASQLYPLRFDRTHRVLALMALHLLVAAFMPNVPWLLSAQEKVARGNIAQQGEGLVAIAKEIEREQPKEVKEDAESKRLARRIEALGKKMMRGRMGKKEALTSLGELKKDLEKAAKNDGQNQNSGSDLQNMQQALEQLADQPMESEAGQRLQEQIKKGDAEQAAREMEKLADKMDKDEMSEQEKQKAANDLQKMAKSLKQQGGEQNQRMAEQLEQAAKALQQGNKKQGQQQQNHQGQSQQGQSGGKQQQQQQGGNQGASNALRQMAKSMRQGGSSSNSQQLQKMLNKIRQAERDTGTNGSGQAGQGFKPAPECVGPG